MMLGCRRVTFICGRAGVYAVGAVIAKHSGDERLQDHYLTKFKEVVHCFSILMDLVRLHFLHSDIVLL